MALDPDLVRAWLARTCGAQGVPVRITDPLLVEQVRALLTGKGRRPAPARKRGRSAGPVSQSPDRPDSVGVEGARPALAGADDGVVEDRADDRGLPVEVEASPRSA